MTQNKRTVTRAFAALALAVLGATQANAAAITPGDLVVFRVGDGAATLGTTATADFLDEYTPSGTLVQSIALPSSGATAITSIGNSSTEGILTPSQDGTMLTFTGYRADAGTASPSGSAIQRVLGSIAATGVTNTATSLAVGGTGAARSLATTDGSVYYLGASSGVFYIPSPFTTPSTVDTRNSRQVFLANDIVYASNGSTSTTAKVQHYGALPTGTTTPTAVLTTASADAVNGIYFLDENAGVAGVDTLYALDTVVSQLLKYTYDGTAWSASGSVGTTAVNVVAMQGTGLDVNLYLTTPSAILALTDSSGFGGTLSGTPTSIATAGANTSFRGIGTLPAPSNPAVPEPASIPIIGGALMLGALRRRPR